MYINTFSHMKQNICLSLVIFFFYNLTKNGIMQTFLFCLTSIYDLYNQLFPSRRGTLTRSIYYNRLHVWIRYWVLGIGILAISIQDFIMYNVLGTSKSDTDDLPCKKTECFIIHFTILALYICIVIQYICL